MKCVHIFLHNELKFNKSLFLFINDRINGLEPENHFFVTIHKEVYDTLKVYYDNILLEQRRGADLINYYGSKADWIFIHALNISEWEVFKIKKESAKKIIWRTWGHDLRDYKYETRLLRKLKKIFVNLIRRHRIRQFYGIGMGFKYDSIIIKRLFGELNTFLMPYRGAGFDYKSLTKDNYNGVIRIMVGHSGNFVGNHKKILKDLQHFSDKQIKICLILSYGKEDYINEVKTLAHELYSEEKLEIVEEFMPFEKYMQYLNNIDIAILDMNASAALGNFMKLVYMKKKLYVKRGGLMDYALNSEGIDHGNTDEISNISFEDFIKPMLSVKAAEKFTSYLDDKLYAYKIWHSLLDELEKKVRNDEKK